jgi:sugar phosphate isomerase/epimerase
MMEIGCAGYQKSKLCDVEVLLRDDKAFAEWKAKVDASGITISSLSCHGNPIHPNKQIAANFDQGITDSILLAEKLGVTRINTFSGCPGDSPTSQLPNWVTCSWPEDYLAILEYQWNEVLIPYWKEKVKFARAHGVTMIGLELHPGFCVYNTATLLRLREAVGPEIGANLDPSHLIWQGMDPVAVINALGDAIFHFHAKDTRLDTYNVAKNGVLDTSHYGSVANRSWVFRTVGYGHDNKYWKDIISALRVAGYDHAISIEHEDSLMSTREGLVKAIEFLKEVVIEEPVGEMFWA